LPQDPNPKIDKGLAKILNCSEEARKNNKTWGSMNSVNMSTMKKKLGHGQVRRNTAGGKDASLAKFTKAEGKGAAWFKASFYIGAQVSILRHADFPGAAGPATNPTASACSSARPAPTTPPHPATTSKAKARPKPQPTAPEASSTPLPKFVSSAFRAPGATRISGTVAPAPKARPRHVVLHTYSVGVEHLLEGQFVCLDFHLVSIF
jgi:hypothetical protein